MDNFEPPTDDWQDHRPVDPPKPVAYRSRDLGSGTGRLTRWARMIHGQPGWFGYVHHDESPRCTWFPARELRPLVTEP